VGVNTPNTGEETDDKQAKENGQEGRTLPRSDERGMHAALALIPMQKDGPPP
jgi:hypothetical protein